MVATRPPQANARTSSGGGRYAVYVADGLTIEVTITGDDLDLGRSLPRIEASARTLRHEGERA